MFFVLKLSKLCNLRCTYCYEYDELHLKDRMSIEDLDRFFAWLAADQPARGWPRLRFVFHGGEPLLLEHSYLEALVTSQRRHLDPVGIRYANSLQTNLTRIDDDTIELLDRLQIGLGVSLDVFGGARVSGSGRDSQDKVLANLQKLLDAGAVERLGIGLITVLHRGNVDRIVSTYEFCATLGLSYRVLPVFSLHDTPARMRGLTLEHGDLVAALQRLADHWLSTGMDIEVLPLANYLEAAIHSIVAKPARTYDPVVGDWAYIVNTNGDAYSHAEAYSPSGWMGNIFKQPMREILRSSAREASLVPRLDRARVCTACRYGRDCSRIPLIESLPSERAYADDGALQCPIALPMIDFFRERLSRDLNVASMIAEIRQEQSESTSRCRETATLEARI